MGKLIPVLNSINKIDESLMSIPSSFGNSITYNQISYGTSGMITFYMGSTESPYASNSGFTLDFEGNIQSATSYNLANMTYNSHGSYIYGRFEAIQCSDVDKMFIKNDYCISNIEIFTTELTSASYNFSNLLNAQSVSFVGSANFTVIGPIVNNIEKLIFDSDIIPELVGPKTKIIQWAPYVVTSKKLPIVSNNCKLIINPYRIGASSININEFKSKGYNVEVLS